MEQTAELMAESLMDTLSEEPGRWRRGNRVARPIQVAEGLKINASNSGMRRGQQHSRGSLYLCKTMPHCMHRSAPLPGELERFH